MVDAPLKHPAGRLVCSKSLRCGGCDVLVQVDMALSARNQLPGIVEGVQIGSIMAHVIVKVGDNHIESVITRTSAEELGLKKGDHVQVVVKSTEVMIQKG